jgi:sulfate adenylyltransferase subunit 2
MAMPLDQPHLAALEAEAIHILRETMAQFARPVLLYSIGKDSSVLLHLALKAFSPDPLRPVPLPFPVLHIDTGWKFAEMIAFRDDTARRFGLDLIVHTNPDGVRDGIGPLSHGSAVHTDVMKTAGLKQALDAGRFDAAVGGARRDEEKSRAKERIFSVRAPGHRWAPDRQRPELWHILNGRLAPGETMRVFPLSNWTELDVWAYIARERIPVVPLYFAAPRPVIARDGMLLMRDDSRLTPAPGEKIETMTVRFRTLGCYPLTGAMRSSARTVGDIVDELALSRVSERQGRRIDRDAPAAMERKKQEGYF